MKVKKLISAISAGLGAFFGMIPQTYEGAVCTGHITLWAEIPIIRRAAERNGLIYGSDDWFILLAIRRAENGREGLEFGIMNKRANDLDSQAGWASATILNNRKRWIEAGTPGTFIEFLGQRYCPRTDGIAGHRNWLKNVEYWFDGLGGKR